MRGLRLGLVLAWIGFAGLPLFILAREISLAPAAWHVWSDSARLASLLRNTALLVTGTLALALPAGCLSALVLYRSDVPGRHWLRRLVVLCMFVPLPLLASAWQSLMSLFGLGTLYLQPGWGLITSIIIQSAAGLPWVIWLAGQGFVWVERHVEEDALTSGGAWSAFWHVTLPRAMPAIWMAAIWVGVQTASEITITDMCQVRTFAEEVFTQFVKPDPVAEGTADGQSRALAVAIPPALLTGLAVTALTWRWRHRLPPLGVPPPSEWPLLRFRAGRLPVTGLIWLMLLIAAGVPIASLIWKAGRIPPHDWSASVLFQQMARAWQAQSIRMFTSLLWSAITGACIAMLALLICWCGLKYRGTWRAIVLCAVVLWSLPGPVIGIGLKETINSLMDVEDLLSGQRTEIVSTLLYNGQTPLPVMWATALRFTPFAIALLWPIVRLLPDELRASVHTESGLARVEFRHVVWPLSRLAVLRATLICTALCLGELSASKIVETPAGQTFTHEIFTQMHTGVSNHLASMCLILLGFVAVIGALIGLIPAKHGTV